MNARRWAAALVAVTVVGYTGAGAASRRNADRPFDHRRHESVSCRSCHGTGDQHRAIFIRTARDCASCHHDASRNQQCTDCHSQEQMRSVSGTVVPLKLSVRDTVVARPLPFAHATHQRVDCKQCHGTPVTLERNRECAACHQNHHRAEANCSACHVRPRESAHPAEAHLACATSGCHTFSVTAPPAPAESRSLCLICHRQQATHEPGKTCAACHKIPDAETAAAIRAGAP